MHNFKSLIKRKKIFKIREFETEKTWQFENKKIKKYEKHKVLIGKCPVIFPVLHD